MAGFEDDLERVDSEDSSPERPGAIKNPCGHFSSDDDAF
jgi:hypothetical protein